MDILACVQCLQPHVTVTTLHQFSQIAFALLVMTGRVTMLGLSRWTGKGGSYRTVQRFFSTVLPWATLFWVFFRQHVYRPEEVSLLVGDEVVATKAGKHTHGLDRFFASLYGKPVPGLAFFTSKNTPQADVPPTPECVRITGMLDALLTLIAGVVPLTSFVLDGHFGNHNAVQMAQQSHLHLISKLRCDAALYFPSTGPYAGRGPRRKYGRKVDYANMPQQYLKATTVEGHIATRLSQAQLLHKEFAHPVNVVIIVKTNLRTQAQAHVLLFSSDLTLAYTSLIDYYGLRFQIEFHFRDAKQYWGLEDVMNVTPTGVTNAANRSVFMVNVAYRLRTDSHQHAPDYSVLDLKADCRGSKYVEETIKMLPEKPEPVLFAKILNQVAGLGRIHATQPSLSFS